MPALPRPRWYFLFRLVQLFIISVKYSPSDLKNQPDPGTVTYTIDGATIVLQKK